MIKSERSVSPTDNKFDGMDELEFIRVAETTRRTNLIMERDEVSKEVAHERAKLWISSETEQTQLTLPLEPTPPNVYRVYYRRYNDDIKSEYRLLNVVVKGVLHSWQSTNTVLADIIRNRFDKQCGHVVTFHATREHDFDIPDKSDDTANRLNDIEKRRKIAELEEQIRSLKKD
ncbi:MAG: hypothetical protein V3U65_06200 [Granulosicoccaceae bacterium]